MVISLQLYFCWVFKCEKCTKIDSCSQVKMVQLVSTVVILERVLLLEILSMDTKCKCKSKHAKYICVRATRVHKWNQWFHIWEITIYLYMHPKLQKLPLAQVNIKALPTFSCHVLPLHTHIDNSSILDHYLQKLGLSCWQDKKT